MGACYQNEQKKSPGTIKIMKEINIEVEENNKPTKKKESLKEDNKIKEALKEDTKIKETLQEDTKIKERIQADVMKVDIKDNRVNECILQKKENPFEKIDRQIMTVAKSVCKLKVETETETIIGTGFLLKFWIDQEPFFCLMSNEHIIRKDIINKNNIIYIYYDNEYKVINMKLDQTKRYIKSFKDEDLDVTVIEILEEDNIFRDYFLWNNLETDNNRIINSEIYIPQYAQGKDLVNARGKLIKINKYEFTHLANTEYGSSGSPIFLENSINVIGIHKQGNKNKTENYGEFIYPVINIIKEDIKKKRDKGKYINGKYIWEDGKYYIGEYKNNKPWKRKKILFKWKYSI